MKVDILPDLCVLSYNLTVPNAFKKECNCRQDVRLTGIILADEDIESARILQ